MSSSVDQIKSKLDIVTVVSSYIKLDKAGGNWKGRCPFHNEKTPSFFVSPDRGSYYCFGCQNKGDIFTFVQEFEGLDFIGSLKVLADRAGVVLEKFEKGDRTEKERLHSVLEQALFFYQKKLSENKQVIEYLYSRGVTDKTIEEFRIGFAPADWRELYEYLLARSVTEKDMLEVGLVKKKYTNYGGVASVYDTFRGRVMFPIADSSGRIVAFSGRILVPDEKSPKYLNSPETSLFNKSEILFGLDKAKKDIRLKDYSVLVEGQMDLVMLHQAGITNTVASSGTALTAEHLIRLRRLSNRIIMAFDGDSAGFSASNRSAQLALSLGMELKMVRFPEGKDPADLAKDDPEALREMFRGAKHIIDFYTETLLSRKMEARELAMEIQKHVLPYVSQLPSTIEKDHFIKSIAHRTFIKEDALWDDLKRVNAPNQIEPKALSGSPPIERVKSILRKVLGIIMWQKEKKETDRIINPEEIEKKLEEIISGTPPEQSEGYKTYKTQVTTDSLLFETESYYNNNNNLPVEIGELLSGLEEEYLKKQFGEAMINLQKAEQSRNSEEVLKYLEQCQELSRKLNDVKNRKL